MGRQVVQVGRQDGGKSGGQAFKDLQRLAPEANSCNSLY